MLQKLLNTAKSWEKCLINTIFSQRGNNQNQTNKNPIVPGNKEWTKSEGSGELPGDGKTMGGYPNIIPPLF